MRTRRFGASGLQVSEMVLGAGFVGGLFVHGEEAAQQAAFDRALAAGVNWIDTAAAYGDGRSEQAIGRLLQGLPADRRPYISTKFRLDETRLDDIPGQIDRAIEESLTRLKLDSVELFQLHNRIGSDGLGLDQLFGDGGICHCLDQLKAQGLIRQSGFTALGTPDLCHAAARSGRFQSAQVYYNLLNPSAGQPVPETWPTSDFRSLIDTCDEQGVAVMNIRIFAAGVLASPQRHGREIQITPGAEIEVETKRAEQVFALLRDDFGTPAQTALRFGLANPKVSCVVIGLAEPAHLDEALAGAEMGPLPETAISRLQPLWQSGFA